MERFKKIWRAWQEIESVMGVWERTPPPIKFLVKKTVGNLWVWFIGVAIGMGWLTLFIDLLQEVWLAFVVVTLPTLAGLLVVLWLTRRRSEVVHSSQLVSPSSEITSTIESLLPEHLANEQSLAHIYEVVEQIKFAFENPREIENDPEFEQEVLNRKIAWLDASTSLESTVSNLREGIVVIGDCMGRVNELVLGDFSGLLTQAVSEEKLTDVDAQIQINAIAQQVNDLNSQISENSESCRSLVIDLSAQLRVLATTPNSPVVRSRVDGVRGLSKAIKGLEFTGTLSALLEIVKTNTFSDEIGESFSAFDASIRSIVPWSKAMISSCEIFLKEVGK